MEIEINGIMFEEVEEVECFPVDTVEEDAKYSVESMSVEGIFYITEKPDFEAVGYFKIID